MKFCRVCEADTNLLHLLLENNSLLIDKLTNFVVIDVDDKLPKWICKDCANLLELTYKFIEQCQTTDLKLRDLLNETGSKNEEEEDPSDDVPNDSGEEYPSDIQDPYSDPELNDIFTLHKEPSLEHEPRHEQDRVECDICSNTFKNVKILVKHKRVVHKNIVVEVCTICGKGFSSKSEHISHLPTHSDDKKFSCEICGRKSKTNSDLKKHQTTHLPKERRPPGQNCSVCLKFFTTHNYKNHMRTHTGETPFKCKICEMKFNRYSTLKRHQLVHTKERRFICEICGSCFARPDYLKSHTQKIHESIEQRSLI